MGAFTLFAGALPMEDRRLDSLMQIQRKAAYLFDMLKVIIDIFCDLFTPVLIAKEQNSDEDSKCHTIDLKQLWQLCLLSCTFSVKTVVYCGIYQQIRISVLWPSLCFYHIPG